MPDLLTGDSEALRRASAETDSDMVEVRLTFPRETAELVLKLIEAQRRGGALVIPARQEFTPAEAATILGISRPHVYKLIDEGRLDHRKVGTHRRIPARSLTAFQVAEKEQQQDAMAELARLSDEFDVT